MFTDKDINNAKQVEPLDFVTRVSERPRESTVNEKRVPPFAPAVVIFTLLLVSAPKGAVLETTISAVNFVKSAITTQAQPSDPNSIKVGNTSINAKDSDVQNVQIINNQGKINISSKK